MEPVKISTTFDEEQKSKFVGIVTKMLGLQMMTVAGQSIIDYENQVNSRALGYICGFITAALETTHQDVNNSEFMITVAYDVLKNLYPGHEVRLLEFLVENARQGNEALKFGMEVGGHEFIVCTQAGDKSPLGLAHFITEGNGAKSVH